MNENRVAYTMLEEPLLPPEIQLTADFAYIRWHRRGVRPWYNYHYSKRELEEWVPRVKKVSKKVEKVYGDLNNHYHGYVAENCIEILEMLNTSKPEQTRTKEKIIRYNAKKRPLVYGRKLEEYLIPVSELGVEDLLLKMTDKARLNRAKKIKDEELTIEKINGKENRGKNKGLLHRD